VLHPRDSHHSFRSFRDWRCTTCRSAFRSRSASVIVAICSEETLRKLAQLADRASTAERRVSPMQVAAQLLEEAVAECREVGT
jgi:hypothetical protein